MQAEKNIVLHFKTAQISFNKFTVSSQEKNKGLFSYLRNLIFVNVIIKSIMFKVINHGYI
jgi:hypothetical protein